MTAAAVVKIMEVEDVAPQDPVSAGTLLEPAGIADGVTDEEKKSKG
jgi:hypothetical protein